MELARVLQQSRRPDRAIDSLRALEQRRDRLERQPRLRRRSGRICRARRIPPGSGRYPEPKWLGMIQHDMMLFDHGMPRADGTMSHEQRPEADVNVEFQIEFEARRRQSQSARLGAAARERKICHRLSGRRRQPHDQHRFHVVHGSRAVDQRARKRARHADRQRLGSAVASADGSSSRTYTDKDFRLGLNAAQTTLGGGGATRRRDDTALNTSVTPLHRKTNVAAIIIRNESVVASSETRHRLIHEINGPAPRIAEISTNHRPGEQVPPRRSVHHLYPAIVCTIRSAWAELSDRRITQPTIITSST